MRNILWKKREVAAQALGIIAFAMALAACGSKASVEIPATAIVRLSDQFTGEFSLVDQNGVSRTQDDFRGKIGIVYFGFATCPDVCPLALGNLSAALNELSARERDGLAALFITVDPQRDTPEALKAYLAFDERIVGLTGAPADAAAARAAFKVYAKKQVLTGSALGYTMDHSSLFYVVDVEGRPQLAVHDTVNAQQLAEILRRALKGRLT